MKTTESVTSEHEEIFSRAFYEDVSEEILVDTEKMIANIAYTHHVELLKFLMSLKHKTLGVNTFFALPTLVLFLKYKYGDSGMSFLARISQRTEHSLREIWMHGLKNAVTPTLCFSQSLSAAAAEIGFSVQDILNGNKKQYVEKTGDALLSSDVQKNNSKKVDPIRLIVVQMSDVVTLEIKTVDRLRKLSTDESATLLFTSIFCVYGLQREELYMSDSFKSDGIRSRQGDHFIFPRKMFVSLMRKSYQSKQVSLSGIAKYFLKEGEKGSHATVLNAIRVHEKNVRENSIYRELYFGFLTTIFSMVIEIMPLIRKLDAEEIPEDVYCQKRKEFFDLVTGQTIKRNSVIKNLPK